MLDAMFAVVDNVRSAITLIATVVAALFGTDRPAGVVAAQAGPPAALRLEPCHLRGLSEPLACGALLVPEDRADATSPRIPVHVTVVPAFVRDKAPDPLVVLAGGPGQGARTYGTLIPTAFQRVRRTRDIVLVDLRGTGDSGALRCPPEQPFALFRIGGDAGAAAIRCRDALRVNPAHYTHAAALADLHEVLVALGVDRVNLWGGSWGTRSALIFAARYPAMVRTVTLDGAVPMDLDFPWSYPVDAQAALDQLFADCAADTACAAAFPNARQSITQWLTLFEHTPPVVTVAHPRSGEAATITLTRAGATEAIRAALYSPSESSRLLALLDMAARGQVAPLIAAAERASNWSVDTMALGQTFSILCSEDVRLRHPPTTMPATLFGMAAIDFWIASCRNWPLGPPLEITADTVSRAPALILSGARDPVTPPARGDAMRRHFPTSTHVIVPGGGHNVSTLGCVPRLIAAFIERGDGSGLDPACAAAVMRPPFVTSLAGSRP